MPSHPDRVRKNYSKEEEDKKPKFHKIRLSEDYMTKLKDIPDELRKRLLNGDWDN